MFFCREKSDRALFPSIHPPALTLWRTLREQAPMHASQTIYAPYHQGTLRRRYNTLRVPLDERGRGGGYRKRLLIQKQLRQCRAWVFCSGPHIKYGYFKGIYSSVTKDICVVGRKNIQILNKIIVRTRMKHRFRRQTNGVGISVSIVSYIVSARNNLNSQFFGTAIVLPVFLRYIATA